MPSKTQKQARFMAAAAHNPKFAKRAGIKQSVAREFNKADTGTKRLSKAMKKRKYQSGGLAQLAKAQMAHQPNSAQSMRPPSGRAALINPAMRRPPAPGGLRMALGGQMPPRRMVPPSMPPVGMMDPRGSGPKLQPGGPSGPRPDPRAFPGIRPGIGALSQLGSAGGSPGGVRRPQLAQGVRSPIAGRLPGPGGQNGLLRTAGGAYRNPGNRMMGGMPRARFAGGGRVKKAVQALNSARSMLHDSDPDFDHIASLLAKDVPEAKSIAAQIRKTANATPKTDDPDEFRAAWQKINKQLNDLKKRLRAMPDPAE